MLTNPVIAKINQEQLLTNRPRFKVGDTIAVIVRVIEGGKERAQTFQGVVVAIRNRGLHSSFIVRKISHGVGVERTFQLHSRQIQEIRLVRTGLVRQAKIYYMRERSGKAARIAERFGDKPVTSKTAQAVARANAETAAALTSSAEATIPAPAVEAVPANAEETTLLEEAVPAPAEAATPDPTEATTHAASTSETAQTADTAELTTSDVAEPATNKATDAAVGDQPQAEKPAEDEQNLIPEQPAPAQSTQDTPAEPMAVKEQPPLKLE